IVQTVRSLNENALIIIISDTLEQAEALYEAGATHVIMPHYIGAHFAANMLVENKYDEDKHAHIRERHIAYLEKLKYLSMEKKAIQG
ncbi:hypothetical protein KAZ57_02135, partial [Patescibacteria group bacterium]|nr:hypothetical protein [Patescibacteria group bacterium]